MSMGEAIAVLQKCHTMNAFPTSYRGPLNGHSNVKRKTPPTVLEPVLERRNAKELTHQREGFNIQTQVMSTKCQSFPNNLQGAIEATQKCYGVCAPTIFIWSLKGCAETPQHHRSKGRAKILLQKCHVTNAFPNQLQGFNAQSQKCHNAHNPRKGATFASQKCHSANAPTEFGPPERSRNAKSMPPNNQRPTRHRSNAIAEAPRN